MRLPIYTCGNVMQNTIFKTVSYIVKIQDSVLSCIYRKLFETILTTVKLKILLEDTFPDIPFTKIRCRPNGT